MLKQLHRSELAGPSLWEEHWREFSAIRYDADSLRWDGFLDLLDARIGCQPILEAGCGLGRYLLYLRARGVRSVGIDFAREPLETIRRVAGPAPLVAGDLVRLPFASNSFGTILCLGVIEHFDRAAAAVMMAELARVLKPGGDLMVTVPYANAIKRWRAASGGANVVAEAAAPPDGWTFYQFCYTPGELRAIVEGAGLHVVLQRQLGSLFSLAGMLEKRRRKQRVHNGGSRAAVDTARRRTPDRIADRRAAEPPLKRLLKEAAYRSQGMLPSSILAHMTLAIGRKPLAGSPRADHDRE